jgi:very-short-patch-repair endonuclease
MPTYHERPTTKLIRQILEWKLPEPELEVLFAVDVFGRKWRADLCWPERKLIVEVDGGVYVGGRHTRGRGYEEDCRKQAAGVLLGFRWLKVTPTHIDTEEAVKWISAAIERRFETWDTSHKNTSEPWQRGPMTTSDPASPGTNSSPFLKKSKKRGGARKRKKKARKARA